MLNSKEYPYEKLYPKGVYDLLPTGRGFVFIAEQNRTDDGNIVIAYKHHSFSESATTLVARSVFLLAKFGPNYAFYQKNLPDFINCRAASLPGYRTLIVLPTGEAMIYDNDCVLKWQGAFQYKDLGPADIAPDGDFLWCSYPENNEIIKYNLKTMRMDMRIGSPGSDGLPAPYGIFINQDHEMIVTSGETDMIYKLNLETFFMEQYQVLTEPAYKYIKVESNEVILTDSGIFRL